MYEFCMNNKMFEEDNYQSDPDEEYQRSTKEKIDFLNNILTGMILSEKKREVKDNNNC